MTTVSFTFNLAAMLYGAAFGSVLAFLLALGAGIVGDVFSLGGLGSVGEKFSWGGVLVLTGKFAMVLATAGACIGLLVGAL